MSEILLAAVRRRRGGARDRTGPSFRSFRRSNQSSRFLIRKAEASRRALKALEKKKKKRCRSPGVFFSWRDEAAAQGERLPGGDGLNRATFKSVQTQQWGGRGGKAERCVNVHSKIMGFSRSSIRAENKAN